LTPCVSPRAVCGQAQRNLGWLALPSHQDRLDGGLCQIPFPLTERPRDVGNAAEGRTQGAQDGQQSFRGGPPPLAKNVGVSRFDPVE
jgi:hypothetical protein